ncbi:uncharacterized protein [Vicugna pacos]|uniref:Uncharacterized protein isoform X4 n=1 Tax=Vicugna pacos TaxID=30538 RepID=A0ABM5BZY8_VICPA
MYFLSVRKQHAGGARRGRRRHFKGAETQTACGGGCAEPAEAFKTQDGYLVVGAGNNQQFATVCKILNLPELIDDSMYRTNHLRVQNRNELIKILSTRLLRICCIQLKTRHLLWKRKLVLFAHELHLLLWKNLTELSVRVVHYTVGKKKDSFHSEDQNLFFFF